MEVTYGIASRKEAGASAKRLLGRTGGPWGMENQLPSVRDVALGEDGCRVRKGSAPQVRAAVRNAVIRRLAGVEADGRAAALRRRNNHPQEAPGPSRSPRALNSE